VTESITVDFTQQTHGIYRDIPLAGTWTWQDSRQDVSGDYVETVSDVNVQDCKFTTSENNGYEEIKIGDPDVLVQGMQTYVLSYKLQFSGDGSKDFDQVYYNIIGSEWNTTIDHVLFSVTLPSAFDDSKLGFSLGAVGTSGYNPQDLTVIDTGTTITGETNRALQPNEGLTMRLVLPEGYFGDGDLSVTTGGQGGLTITPEANPDTGAEQAKNAQSLALLMISIIVALSSPAH
jgi:hypothetical protein